LPDELVGGNWGDPSSLGLSLGPGPNRPHLNGDDVGVNTGPSVGPGGGGNALRQMSHHHLQHLLQQQVNFFQPSTFTIFHLLSLIHFI